MERRNVVIINNGIRLTTQKEELNLDIIDFWRTIEICDTVKNEKITMIFKDDKQIYELIGELFILLGDKQR